MIDCLIKAARVKAKRPAPTNRNAQNKVRIVKNKKHLIVKIKDSIRAIAPMRYRAFTLRITKGSFGMERNIRIISITTHKQKVPDIFRNGIKKFR